MRYDPTQMKNEQVNFYWCRINLIRQGVSVKKERFTTTNTNYDRRKKPQKIIIEENNQESKQSCSLPRECDLGWHQTS
jgi:hypothetical protein